MSTKTLTIMEDAYKLLLENKLEKESFSEELRRVLSKRKKKGLIDFFGILSEEEGEEMINDLKRLKSMEIKLMKERIK